MTDRPNARSRVGVGILVGLIASATFATSGPFARALFAIDWTPGAAAFWRIAVAAVVMVPLGLWVMRDRLGDIVGEWRSILVFGVAAVATPQLMFFGAVSRMSVSIALLIEYMAPVLLVLIACAHTRRPPAWGVGVGTVISVGGLLCVLDLAGATPDPVGILFAFGGMLGAASYFFLSARPTTLHPVTLAAFGLVTAAVVLGIAILARVLPYSAPLRRTELIGTPVPWWVPLLVVALIATATAYGTGIAGVSLMGERLASFVSLSEVLFAAALAALMLAEIPSPIQLLGGVLIVVGVVFVRAGTSS